jgi:hypothetical protein
MNPIPCAHCGNNFMRPTIDPEAPKLCNNCLIREEKRNPPKKENMEQTIDIKIKCPISVHNYIEEYCLNNGIDLTKYFLSLHESFKQVQEMENPSEIEESQVSESKSSSHKSKKK